MSSSARNAAESCRPGWGACSTLCAPRGDPMRVGAVLLLVLAFSAGARAGPDDPDEKDRTRFPRGPYLLRQIFGDVSQSMPAVWGAVPGTLRQDFPPETDLGEEVSGGGSPTSFLREVSDRATVTFVFDGPGTEARLNHITVTVCQAPNITPKGVLTHLTKIYGAADPPPPGGGEEILGSWQKGAVLLRHFPAARFFEVTLSSQQDRSAAAP
jgi:hypothetical protein